MKKVFILSILFICLIMLVFAEEVKSTWEQNNEKLDSYYTLGDYENGRNFAKEVLSATKDKYGEKTLETALAYNYLGLFEIALNKQYDAISNYKSSLEILYKMKKDEAGNIGIVAYNLGYAYFVIGDDEKALKYYNESYNYLEKTNKNDYIDQIILTLYDRSLVYEKMQEYEKAINDMKKLIDIEIQEYGIDAQLASDYKDLAYLYKLNDNFTESEKYYKKSIDTYKELNNKEYDNSIGIALNDMGVLYSNNEKYEQAIEIYNQALIYYEKAETEEEFNKEIPNTLYNRALAYYYVNNHSDALDDMSKSYEMYKTLFGENSKEAIFLKQELDALKSLIEKQ